MKTSAKLLNKYVGFCPHPESLDKTNAPLKRNIKGVLIFEHQECNCGGNEKNSQAMTLQTSCLIIWTIMELVKENAKQIKKEIFNKI